MRIHGIGADLIDIKRIQRLLDKYPDKFIARILSPAEIDNFRSSATPLHYVAKRFAAKEAVSKALGTGIGQSMAFNEISILNHHSGKPYVVFSGNAKCTIDQLKIQEVFISLSDENDFSLAFAIASV